jgi:hypothetical protein
MRKRKRIEVVADEEEEMYVTFSIRDETSG